MAMVFTYDEIGPVHVIIGTWTSDGSGDASDTTKKIVGELIKGVTNPGSAAPTDDYDITVSDEDSFNVLTSTDDDLLNRDTSNTEEVYFFEKDHAGTPLAQPVRPVVADKLTIAVANAGSAKNGVLKLYWAPGVK